MAGPGRIQNLKPFPKGVSGNPYGTPHLPPEIRAERRKNQASLIKLVIQYFSFTDEQAKERVSGPEANQLEEAIQGMISKSKEGDTNAFKYLMELICGKIPETDPGSSTDEMTFDEKLVAMKYAVEMMELQKKKNNGSGNP